MKKIFLFLMLGLLLNAQASVAQTSSESDYLMRKVAELLNDNNTDEALKYVNQHIESNPKSPEAYFQRGKIYFLKDMYSDALTDMNKAQALWHKKCLIEKYTLAWWKAEIYVNMQMTEKGIEELNLAYKLFKDKNDIETKNEILQRRAQLYYELDDYESADADYRLMLKNNEAEVLAMIGLVRNMMAREDYQSALEMANTCQKYSDTYSEVYRFRMQIYDKMGEHRKAIDDAIKYIKYDENANRGQVTPIFRKKLPYALAKVNEKINSVSENYTWKMLRAIIYELSLDYTSAANAYTSIEKEYGSSSYIHYYRSSCYGNYGNYELAIADITKCIEAGDGSDSFALLCRALFYQYAQQYENAVADCSKIIEQNPSYAYIYTVRAKCHEHMGNDDAALEDYNTGIDMDEDYPQIFLQRGKLYQKQGKVNLAKKDFEYVVEIDTALADGSCRPFALHFLGRDAEALEWMDKIIAEDSLNDGAYYNKACLLSLMNRQEEAVATLKVSFDKGYNSIAYIKHDSDLDAIRNHPEYVALMKACAAKNKVIEANDSQGNDVLETLSEVEMKKVYSGVYEMSCSINGLPLTFIFDTGASEVTISSVEASFMLKNNYLSKEDIVGKEYFSTATGEIREGTKIRLKEIKIGNAILRNVEASVVHNQQAPLLLGQSVLERFGTITIDNINSKLIIKQ